MAQHKKYKVIIRIEKEVTRIVTASNSRSAEAKVKRNLASKLVKISTRNFEKYPTVIYLY